MKYLRTFTAYVVAYISAYIVEPVASFFDKGVDGLVRDFTKLDTKLDTFLDRQARRREALIARRRRLRDMIDGVWDEVRKVDQEIDRAARVQNKVREIVR